MSDINTTSSTERGTRTYQTLWFDHGTDPVAASYAYLLMPGASARTPAARAADPDWLRILDNSADRQAVSVPSLGLHAANLWQAGTVGRLTVSAPVSVLVRRRRSVLDLRISEPPPAAADHARYRRGDAPLRGRLVEPSCQKSTKDGRYGCLLGLKQRGFCLTPPGFRPGDCTESTAGFSWSPS